VAWTVTRDRPSDGSLRFVKQNTLSAMADRLAEGLWWLHGTRGSNVFLVEADDGQLVIVDCGFGSSATATEREVHIVGHERPLSAILLTHRHADHAGAAEQLRTATGAEVIAGMGDCVVMNGASILRPTLGRSHSGPMFRRFGGEARVVHVAQAIDRETEVRPGIWAVPAPGHTPGSLCFVVDRLNAAFVGDLVISHAGRLTRSMRAANQDDRRYLETMHEFGAIAPEIGLPGHGVPVMAGFGDSLRDLAALPRRRGGPRTIASRAVRMAAFTHGMMRPRNATRR
jgi:glyoxylase-like metal-dependent hydrolase (beta-lactamase superfamily II)